MHGRVIVVCVCVCVVCVCVCVVCVCADCTHISSSPKQSSLWIIYGRYIPLDHQPPPLSFPCTNTELMQVWNATVFVITTNSVYMSKTLNIHIEYNKGSHAAMMHNITLSANYKYIKFSFYIVYNYTMSSSHIYTACSKYSI